MYRLLGILIVFLSIGGCSVSQLTVREDSVIPDVLLSDAYRYADVCIKQEAQSRGLDPLSAEEGVNEAELAIVGECMDSMFILYARTTYTVIDRGIEGKFVPICRSENINAINDCLSL